jgi:hypothetical protein
LAAGEIEPKDWGCRLQIQQIAHVVVQRLRGARTAAQWSQREQPPLRRGHPIALRLSSLTTALATVEAPAWPAVWPLLLELDDTDGFISRAVALPRLNEAHAGDTIARTKHKRLVEAVRMSGGR